MYPINIIVLLIGGGAIVLLACALLSIVIGQKRTSVKNRARKRRKE